jgi:CheY-like chemotaxis protein
VRRLPAARVEFAVRDTGQGISQADLAHVFEAFYQGGAARRRSGGAGLGLSIALEMARAMGGSIRCDSELGRGSLFVLDLPLPEVEPHPNTLPRESAWMLGDLGAQSRRVLLAEDNEVNALVVEAMLDRIGCKVIKVDNGDDAVRLGAATDRDIDLVLMDCQMPVLDGYAAAAEIRASEGSGPPIWIIAMTAHAMGGDREKCLAAGMDDYLAKPVVKQALREALQRFEQHAAASPS